MYGILRDEMFVLMTTERGALRVTRFPAQTRVLDDRKKLTSRIEEFEISTNVGNITRTGGGRVLTAIREIPFPNSPQLRISIRTIFFF